MKMKLAIAALAVVATLGLYGCGGGGAKTEVSTQQQTLGQELLDLKNAYDAGAMTEDEYNNAREKIMKAHD
jgi:outer membrane murein-binding lipoprotein Lpp